MSLFGGSKHDCLGIDFGSGGIKLVQLKEEKGRARLVTYAFNSRRPGAEPASLVDDLEGTSALLRQMLKQAKTTTVRAIGGLPVASIFSSVVTVPKSAKKEVTLEAARGQAKKLIPVPLEEMSLDIKVIDSPSSKKNSGINEPSGTGSSRDMSQVLITGAANSMIRKYVEIFKRAGLQLVSLETEALALVRSLVGKDRSTIMIVDLGAVRTNIIIVEGGIPFVTRSLDTGGVSLTKIVSQTMGLDITEAEQLKPDIKETGRNQLPKIFEPIVAPLVTELRYSIDMHVSQADNNNQKVEKIILTGGSSGLSMLADFFSSQLNVRTYVGDPWARITYPEGLRPALEEIGPRFAVPVGLAMQQFNG